MDLKKNLSRMYHSLLKTLTVVSPKLSAKITYRRVLGRKLDLKKPKTFNEKINWLKLYDYPKNKLVIQCTDKASVRDYVKNKGLDNILNEVYQIKNKFSEIEFSKLPSEFVVKWNNDYGSTIICRDSSYDRKKLKEKLSISKKKKFYLDSAEMHYSNIPPKIIVEKLLKNDNGTPLNDYKVYCYNGVPLFIMVCLDRQDDVKFYFYDTSWNFLRINGDGKEAPVDFFIPKPICLEEMLNDARILSRNFKFVRNDYYIVNDKPIFGELTFSPAAGFDTSLDVKLDSYLGQFLEL